MSKARHDCVAELEALRDGHFVGWSGLCHECSRQHAESALGPSGIGPDGTGRLAGSYVAFRDYPPQPVAPVGCTVWFGDLDRIVLIRVPQPALARPPSELLGEPEVTLPSELHPFHTQLAYPSRGLVVHVHSATGVPASLFAFRPMEIGAFPASWVATMEGPTRRELPRRD